MVRDASGPCGNWSPRNYSGGGGSGRSMMAIDAFKVSLNVPAVDLSLRLGRDKVLEMTQRLGVAGVKRTCSMALGDTGITPLQHTAAYAHLRQRWQADASPTPFSSCSIPKAILSIRANATNPKPAGRQPQGGREV